MNVLSSTICGRFESTHGLLQCTTISTCSTMTRCSLDWPTRPNKGSLTSKPDQKARGKASHSNRRPTTAEWRSPFKINAQFVSGAGGLPHHCLHGPRTSVPAGHPAGHPAVASSLLHLGPRWVGQPLDPYGVRRTSHKHESFGPHH